METSRELTNCFFHDLKKYNSTNFKAIAKADLSKQDANVHKAFSSVVTRYFIFKEKHPEITESQYKLLYFKLKLDLVAAYFSEYPETTTENLVAFQLELRRYLRESKNKDDEEDETYEPDPSISDIGLESDNSVSIKQQQESEVITA